MIKLDNLSLLVVVPDQGARAKLREVLKSFLYKPNIMYETSLREAEVKIAKGHRYDAVFVAFELGQQDISDLVDRLKSIVTVRVPPFIVTLKNQKSGVTGVVDLYMSGITGFITEPYTADDIIDLLTTVKENRNALETTSPTHRTRKASTFVIAQTKTLLNDLARIRVCGESGANRNTLRDIKKLSGVLSELHKQDPTEYVRALLVAFDRSIPPKDSARIKKPKKTIKQCRHPGAIIKEIVTRKNLDIEHLKGSLKSDAELFISFLDEKANLDDALARELSRLFGRSPSEWMGMQKEYDTYVEQLNRNHV